MTTNPWTSSARRSESLTRGPASLTPKQSPISNKPSLHQLKTDYCLSYTYREGKNSSKEEVDWSATIRPLATFGTCEGFWDVISHIKRPSELPPNTEYHLFKFGIKPIWEDPSNENGGKAIVRLKKGVIDRFWEELVLAMLGNRLLNETSRRKYPRREEEASEADPSDDLCGIIVSSRRDEDVLSVWNKDTHKRDRLKDAIVSALKLNFATFVTYKSHSIAVKRLVPKKAHHSFDVNSSTQDRPPIQEMQL